MTAVARLLGNVDPRVVLAVLASAATVAAVTRLLIPPPAPLSPRVRPYSDAAHVRLGVLPAAAPGGSVLSTATLRGLVEPIVRRLARAFGELVDSASDDGLLLRLRQAGVLADVPEAERVQVYRTRQLATAAAATVLPIAALVLAGAGAGLVLLGAAAGFVYGTTRSRARIDRAIEDRRLRMRVELYTVNQLLALHVRVGGGVVQAISRVVEQGQGDVVAELQEVLRAHRGGRRLADALQQAARTSAEVNAGRTYRLLATGVEHGADLAEALRSLSDDLREQRVEALKRTATRRRAAMLVPIIALLAPIMLLFVAAPLPSLILGVR